MAPCAHTIPHESKGSTAMSNSCRSSLTRRRLLGGVAVATSLIAAPTIVRAQGAPLKVGVLLPRSGAQAAIGQDCHLGVVVAPAILMVVGLPFFFMAIANTETNVEVARARAEKMIND